MAARGRPVGSLKDRTWETALRHAANDVTRDDEGKRIKFIDLAARRLVQAAANGDVAAIKELADRMDGKSVAQLRHQGHDGGPLDLTQMSDEQLSAALARLGETQQTVDEPFKH